MTPRLGGSKRLCFLPFLLKGWMLPLLKIGGLRGEQILPKIVYGEMDSYCVPLRY
jgi:hypothetical protein